ncbi:FAD-dependent oxidoreductase [Luteibacter aegosomatissinici]|uniref:FAD-dependent oxidoreductase n=1 Tax=Luteibacter aegosomatissinici TaxID=2911539 RepID=UPI001FF88B08|nr:FAD-dependent oxidoreductase [Luteibacter aegosomatissinici]UPG92708.1 FAD-dependent oxidoreductase [Luteibacter aegosomatissinici]
MDRSDAHICPAQSGINGQVRLDPHDTTLQYLKVMHLVPSFGYAAGGPTEDIAMTAHGTGSGGMDGRDADAFPRLDDDMLQRLARYGVEEDVAEGTVLYERGQRAPDFFVVVKGSIEAFEHDAGGVLRTVTVHREGQISGELDTLTDREIKVSGRAGPGARVIRLRRDQFRSMVSFEPDIGEVVMRAYMLRRARILKTSVGGLIIIGPAHGGDTQRIRRFLERNNYPFALVDTETDEAGLAELESFNLSAADLPVVMTVRREVLKNPGAAELADTLGLTERIEPGHVFDVTVVGAGPAGLAAAVYAASEGLDTLVIESLAPGGQAGTSSKIENYLGFPAGVSGHELAGRAQAQAQKFGARLSVSRAAVSLDCSGRPLVMALDDGQFVMTRSIVIATGARYRKLVLNDYARFEGQGIHYAATHMEAQLSAGSEVVVVGGGNSAGQAAVFLAASASHVHILVRGEGLAETMSDYLVRRIEQSSRITLHARSSITALNGGTYLEEVIWHNSASGVDRNLRVSGLFVMIGAEPNTDWLGGCLPLDAGGFVLTGIDAGVAPDAGGTFATAKPGIFAIGDVRSGSIKRVAAGVGEGSAVIASVHQYLAPPLTEENA